MFFNRIRYSIALALSLMVVASGFSGCEKQKAQAVSVQIKYDAADAIEQAQENLSDHPTARAALLTGVAARDKVLALTFDGCASSSAMNRVLQLLEQYQTHASFFMTGMEAAENEEILYRIEEKQHPIGCGTLYGTTHMEEKTTGELAQDFAHAGAILDQILDSPPEMIKCRSTIYDDKVLAAAAAAGFSSAVQSNQYVSYQSFRNYESALGYVSRLENGSILTIKLSGVLDEDEYSAVSETKDAYMPGDRQPGIKDSKEEEADREQQLLQVVEWVLKAADEADYRVVALNALNGVESFGLNQKERQAQFLQNRQDNQGRLAGELNMVYTTERAAALTFYGVSNEQTLDGVLSELARLGVQGTFFVSEADINEHPNAVQKVVASGHEVGAAILPNKGLDYFSVCEQIYMVQSLMKMSYGADVRLVTQIYDTVPNEAREAVAAMGMRLVGYSSVVDTSGRKGGAQEIIDALFKNAGYTIQRGEILYIRMDAGQQGSGLAAQVIRLLSEQVLKNTADTIKGVVYAPSYSLKGVSRLTGGAGAYAYPVPAYQVLPECKDKIYSGHLKGKTDAEKFAYIRARYIGNPDTASVSQFPGFTTREVSQLDKVGKLKTGKSNVVFLTFDDWGTDQAINKLLDVLEKHNVKATFFVRTNYVRANPNLLRAIGAQGHGIASHTDAHLPLAVYTKGSKFVTITEEEAKTLRQDVQTSYKVLQDVVGDMRNEKGLPVLTRLFRPPTLAVSAKGLEAVLDNGFSYSVSGDFSTGDYKSTSADELYKLMVNGMPVSGQMTRRKISGGSIIVMHMSDTAQYTAEALDKFLTWNETRPAQNRFTFARLGDYLQGS